MTDAVTKLERPRLSPDDWAAAALDLIAEQGVAALAVEVLAKHLGVTKGSFYWHFPSRDALLTLALERWEAVEVETVLGPVEAIADPRERLRELFLRTSREVKSHAIYSSLIRAVDHPLVAPVVERVSQRRMDYLMMAFLGAGMQRREAVQRARLTYAAYVGFLQMSLQLHLPRLTAEEFEAYVDHVITTLIP
jgi:AcrR family transcriptional regulator